MAQASYKKKVRVSADGTNWEELPCTSPSLDFGSEVVDTTNLASNEGFRSREQTLHDWSVSADSNYVKPNEPGRAGLDMVRASKLGRTPLFVQYLPGGVSDLTSGYQGPVVVETFNVSGDVGGIETVAISLQANGALAVAS